jgi:hypothetical protein
MGIVDGNGRVEIYIHLSRFSTRRNFARGAEFFFVL